jgi:hypothetical protein
VRTRFTAPQGTDALDQFWFDTREGNGEFFAAAYVVLMRSAGIPARLVTGYRGGKLMALTDYVVVKRSHAHAWAEVWREDKGWTRIDPTDIVHPDTAGRPSTQSPRPQPTPAAPSAPAQDTAATQAPAALPVAPATRQARPTATSTPQAGLPALPNGLRQCSSSAPSNRPCCQATAAVPAVAAAGRLRRYGQVLLLGRGSAGAQPASLPGTGAALAPAGRRAARTGP